MVWAILGISLSLVACGSGDRSAGEATGASKTLLWAAVPEPSVLGYKLYWGTNSRHYESQVNVSPHVSVGPDIRYTLSGLRTGTVYYFAVSAYNSGGESDLSEEVTSYVE